MTIDDLIGQLQVRLDALGNGRDAKSENERATYRRDYDRIQNILSGLQNLPADVAKYDARLAVCVERRTAVVAKQKSIEQEIADAPDPSTFTNARERDREYDRQESLKKSLALLRAGVLLQSPGVSFERLDVLDARIVELTTRRNRSSAVLDGLLRDAEALLAEEPVEAS